MGIINRVRDWDSTYTIGELPRMCGDPLTQQIIISGQYYHYLAVISSTYLTSNPQPLLK